MKLFFSLITTTLILSACSSKPAKDAGSNSTTTAKKAQESQVVSMESKQLASEQESNLVAEITFSKEKAFISDQARNELKALQRKAASRGKVGEIKVITWGDQEYPSVHEKELSETQQRLVKMRNDALEKYLDEISKDAKIETFSMAERPDALNKLFSSDEAQIKKSLETAGIPNTDTTVKVPGKASKSVVIFIMEEE